MRVVLLDTRVRRVLASVLARRFLIAAWVTTRPFVVLTGEVLARGQIRTYRIRATGVPVALQHGRDLEALFELFSRGEYDPPGPLRDRLRPDAVQTELDVGADVGMSSAWARGRWPQARIVALEPAPANVAVLREQAGQDGRTEVVVAAVAPADGETGFVEAASGRCSPTHGWPTSSGPRSSWSTTGSAHRRCRHPPRPGGCSRRPASRSAHDTANYWGHGTLWAWEG